MRNPNLKQILKLMENKYPGNTALLIYDDESGRVTKHADTPYDGEAYIYFASIDELIKKLKEKE